MDFSLKDVLYILGIFASGFGAFLATRHGLKEYMRDKLDSLQKDLTNQITQLRKEDKNAEDKLQKQITDLRLELKDLQSRDELQQQVIDQIGKNMDNLIPKLIEATKLKVQVNE